MFVGVYKQLTVFGSAHQLSSNRRYHLTQIMLRVWLPFCDFEFLTWFFIFLATVCHSRNSPCCHQRLQLRWLRIRWLWIRRLRIRWLWVRWLRWRKLRWRRRKLHYRSRSVKTFSFLLRCSLHLRFISCHHWSAIRRAATQLHHEISLISD